MSDKKSKNTKSRSKFTNGKAGSIDPKTANPRWIALQVMLKLVEQGRSLDDIFQSDWFKALPASPRDLALSREIAFGLCRWYFALSACLKQRLQKPLRARDRDVEIVLLIGLQQLAVYLLDLRNQQRLLTLQPMDLSPKVLKVVVDGDMIRVGLVHGLL